MTIAVPDPDETRRPQEFELTDADFRRLAGIVTGTTGIMMPDSKRQLVYSRLARRLRALRMTRFSDYIDLIESPDGGAEHEELLVAITTNVTSFFREAHHFETLTREVLPGLVARARNGGRVRIWSAACSSGEEPYSIACSILDLCPEAPRLNIRILATDIDRSVLDSASAGLYPASSRSDEIAARLKKHVEPVDGADSFRFGREARGLITFKRLNLIEAWPFSGPFDVIFCRNVVIYFERHTQERLWPRFHDALAPGGYLMIGHSERISGPAEARFQTAGVTTYRKP